MPLKLRHLKLYILDILESYYTDLVTRVNRINSTSNRTVETVDSYHTKTIHGKVCARASK